MSNREKNLEAKSIPKPSEFLRSWRPELFSDTIKASKPVLEKSRLEYQLETLTVRKQEQVFEEFCRRLVSMEICPNIKPQTGPTGGGDSKVDASTYPVSPYLGLRCWWGNPNPPSEEAWAFAFSCKKKWSDKVRSDVKEIAKLDRTFSRVYFITSRPTRDKTRAGIEIKLNNEYGVEVHILDRTWIVNTVIEHKRENLAIEILGIEDTVIEEYRTSTKDLARQQEFDDLIEKLNRPELYWGNDYAIAQDYLTAAKIARALEKPRHEIDGLFTRARDIAHQYGYRGQIILCGCEHALTSVWWFDDFQKLEKIYSEIEGFLTATENAQDCESFINLWLLLKSGVQREEISHEKASLDKRLESIRKELIRLINEKGRPSNSLEAETLLRELDLFQAIGDDDKVNKAFNGLKQCLRRSAGLGTYPLMQFVRIFKKMGRVFGNLPGYNSLFDEICSIVKERIGESETGELFYDRGVQLLSNGKPQIVLHYLGKARHHLFKEETLPKAMLASLGCSIAYRSLGLYWAARMEAMLTVNLALRTHESVYEFPKQAFLGTKLLGWLELSLGRIAPFLAWYELSWFLVNILNSMQYDVDSFEDELRIQEGVLGCFLLNLNNEELKGLSTLQDGLDSVNLPMARWALLYSLGDINTLLGEMSPELVKNLSDLKDFFETWKIQPASKQLPKKLTGETHSRSMYETTIMGVRYVVRCRNDFGAIAFAENLLGIIEAAFALAKWENLAFIVDKVDIEIDKDESGHNPPFLNMDSPPDPKGYKFIWRPNVLEWLNTSNRDTYVNYLKQFILKLLLDITIDPLEDLKKELKRWHKEDTFNRAFGISPTSILLTNIIGKERYDLHYWSKPTTP